MQHSSVGTPKLEIAFRRLTVGGIIVACTWFLFLLCQLIAISVRLFLDPLAFEMRGSLGSETSLIGDGLAQSHYFAYLHSASALIAYAIWLVLKRLRARRNKSEFVPVVPKGLYSLIFGFSLFMSVMSAIHPAAGDSDLTWLFILYGWPFAALSGLFLGFAIPFWSASVSSHCEDIFQPLETDLPRTFLRWAGVAVGLGLIAHTIVFLG